MAETDKKRRLPLLQSGPAADDPPEEDRPPWHWSGIGAVATFLVWLPLAAMATKLDVWLADGEPDPTPLRVQIEIVGSQLAGFLIATFAGGFLVGRFGGKAGAREGAVGAFFTAALAWALAAAAPSPGPGAATWALLLVLLGSAGAATGYAGGRVGEKRRPA